MASPSHHDYQPLTPHEVVARRFPPGENVERISPAKLDAHREESLRAIVERAYRGSKLYRNKLDLAGVRPDDISGPGDLSKLPFLTKDELRGRPWDLLTCAREEVVLIQVSTGTTGGEEIYMPYTRNDYLEFDLAPRYPGLLGIERGDVCLNALPYEMSTAGLAFHKLFNGYGATVIPAGKGGAYSTAKKTVKLMTDLRPNVAVTSPSWAVTLAEEAQAVGLDLPALEMKKLWLAGEGCSPTLRGRIETLWGTTANFFYGSLECGMLGIECDAHDGYHLPVAHVLLEVLHPHTGEPVPAGETGELVVTALLRYDAPILRFRTGDLGSLETAPCPCGVSLSRFRLRGREVDQVRVQGRSLSPIYLEELLLRMPEVGNWFQFVTSASDPDAAGIKVRCELAAGLTSRRGLADSLAARMSAATGLPCGFEIVDRLPRPSGKVARVVKD